MMKLTIELFLEIMCIFLTGNGTDVSEIIMDFVALGVISNLDEKYFESLRNPLKDRMICENYEMPI